MLQIAEKIGHLLLFLQECQDATDIGRFWVLDDQIPLNLVNWSVKRSKKGEKLVIELGQFGQELLWITWSVVRHSHEELVQFIPVFNDRGCETGSPRKRYRV